MSTRPSLDQEAQSFGKSDKAEIDLSLTVFKEVTLGGAIRLTRVAIGDRIIVWQTVCSSELCYRRFKMIPCSFF